MRDGRTVIAHAYAEPPFRVGRSFQTAEGLHLVMASSAPGIFGGDVFEQRVFVERGARVRLTSQSAMQVHPAPDGAVATLVSTYYVEAEARLRCEWDPTIPFRDANLDQRVRLELADDASIFWSDAFMAGREARGERWAFAGLAHELKVTRGGSLDYLERYAIRPAEHPVDVPWLAGDARYFGTTLIVDPLANGHMAESLHMHLGKIGAVVSAADLLEERMVLVRLMAATGVPFHEARGLVARWRAEATVA